ncbi:MAG TPA: acyl-CoA thioesterase [Steroidobacteraceae bacterium]|nr:acyl-CoA thioesterase [Steroidobacteraceae bacterium]
MNLWLRLLWLLLAGPRRSPVPPLGPCQTPFRVLPTDLDVLRHVNNGVYLSMMDLARVDLMIRAGLAQKVRAQGWYPVVVAQTIRFRRSLTLFQAFAIETRVLGWDEKAFVLEQRFGRGSELVANAVVRARFLSRAGDRISPRDVLALAGITAPSPALPVEVARWNADQAL